MYWNLKAEMARKAMGNEELAKILGIKTRTVHNKIHKKSPFTIDEIKKICSFFGMNFEYLFEEITSNLEEEVA